MKPIQSRERDGSRRRTSSRRGLFTNHRHLEDAPYVGSLLLGPPPPVMNMSNPLSDPAFNYTYQHSSSSNPEEGASPAEENEEHSEPIHGDDDDDDDSSSGMIMNMTNPLSDPAFNYTYQHSSGNLGDTEPIPADTTDDDHLISNEQTDTTDDDNLIPEDQTDTTDDDNLIPEEQTDTAEDDHLIPEDQTDTTDDDNLDPEQDSTQNNTPDSTIRPAHGSHMSPPTKKKDNKSPEEESEPDHTQGLPQKPTPAGVQCTEATGLRHHLSCKANRLAKNHPLFAFALVGTVLLFILRLVRNRRRSLSRGEYRAVAASYIDNDFDDSFRDEFSDGGLDGFDDDYDDDDDGWSSGKRTIEMSSLGDEENGGLTLEEVNG